MVTISPDDILTFRVNKMRTVEIDLKQYHTQYVDYIRDAVEEDSHYSYIFHSEMDDIEYENKVLKQKFNTAEYDLMEAKHKIDTLQDNIKRLARLLVIKNENEIKLLNERIIFREVED